MKQEDLYIEVGRNLAIRRRELKKTQLEVSEGAGISRPSLANIEGGRQALTLHQVYKLASVLELSDARSLLPAGNTEISKQAGVSHVEVNTTGSNLNKVQFSQVQSAVAQTTGGKK